MGDVLARRSEVNKRLMDLIANLTKVPIGLYESNDGHLDAIIPEVSRKNFEPHCKLIQSFPGGKERCETDQCNRARVALSSDQEQLICCHAGLYNQLVPIKIGGKTKAVLVYGEMQIDQDHLKQKSLENHLQAVKDLGINKAQAADLKQLLLDAKKYTPEDLQTLKELLVAVEDLLYTLIDEEKENKRIVQRTTHELVTRLQALMNSAENLELEIDTLTRKEVKNRCEQILGDVSAYTTVVQTLGEHLEDYNFYRHSMPEVIREAVKTYEPEAQRRGVEIQLNLQREGDSWVEMSPRHLQLAINNLVHNAIKYSFYGSADKNRFITITGSPEASQYRINIFNYGVGILPEEYKAIFREGIQGKLTKREFRTGSGKGLFFVKRIIDKHNGDIDVESRLMASPEDHQLGKPHLNRFTVYLPYRQPKEQRAHA